MPNRVWRRPASAAILASRSHLPHPPPVLSFGIESNGARTINRPTGHAFQRRPGPADRAWAGRVLWGTNFLPQPVQAAVVIGTLQFAAHRSVDVRPVDLFCFAMICIDGSIDSGRDPIGSFGGLRVNVVPEPGSTALMLFGSAFVAHRTRRFGTRRAGR